MLIRRSGFTHSFQSQKLFIVSWSVQFFSNLRKHRSAVLTFVPHGEQTLVEKDSPFSRKTKSLFFSRSANLWYHSSFSGRSNKHIFRVYPSTLKIAELCFKILQFIRSNRLFRLILSSRSRHRLCRQLAYCHFHSLLILHYIYYISQRSNAKNCFRITASR